MAKFRFYNISLLFNDPKKQNEVGVEGYKKLFEKHQEEVKRANQNRSLSPIAFPLRNEMFIATFTVHIKEKYAYGSMVKYDQPDSIKDLFTGEDITKVAKGGSAHRFLFDFVFNFENHILGIENKDNRLPSSAPMLRALEIFLMDVATHNFKDHSLEIGQVTSSNAVETAYDKAESFKRGEVDVTFTNSTLFNNTIIKEYEKEMKDKGIVHTKLIESAASKGFMKDLSEKFKALLHIAKTTTGSGSFRYVDKNTKKVTSFYLKEHPYEATLIRGKNEKDEEFHERVLTATKRAVSQGTNKT